MQLLIIKTDFDKVNLMEQSNNVDELINLYANEVDVLSACYEMMGRLLDERQLDSQIKKFEISELYIYGGGYLGIQFFRAVKDIVHVISVVDKSGKLLIDGLNIPVINFDAFQCEYQNQIVVITSIKHYAEIYNELRNFVPDDKILFLGNFQEGK